MKTRRLFLFAGLLFGCSTPQGDESERTTTSSNSSQPADSPSGAAEKDDAVMSAKEPDDVLQAARERMIRLHLQGRDITDPQTIEAMRRVPRHELVPPAARHQAYSDQPLPIGHGQTISQPYIVALMTQLAKIKPGATVLDVGTGSGYQAAVLAEMGAKVYSIEIVPELARQAEQQLRQIGYEQIEVRCGDGYRGWPDHAPFDAILVAAAPEQIPQPLIDQLAPGGRLVIPVGNYYQSLILVTKQPDGTVQQRTVASVAFVPMTGEAERSSSRD